MTVTPPGSTDVFDFQLPPHLEAGEPPEARGLRRDDVRMLVSYRAGDRIFHLHFRDLPSVLNAGDVLVINTSGTMNASLPAVRPGGDAVELHLSTRLPGDLWTVELRRRHEDGGGPVLDDVDRETLALPAGAGATILAPYRCGCGRRSETDHNRLWLASLNLPETLDGYLARHGSPIRYSYVHEHWPAPYYQTVYATQMGSAEMPSAGRPFTAELLTRLIAGGVLIAPLVLHTGVASVEAHEPPYEEQYRVPLETARAVNEARARGKRVIAVGTTVVRALETVIDDEGTVHPGEGWTCTVIGPNRGIRSVDALLTGLHEPRSSHLAMLEALADRDHLRLTYAEALKEAYLWHEFGDVHLLLP